MIDKDAIVALKQGDAIEKANAAIRSTTPADIVALPADFGIHDLEKYETGRRRARGSMKTNNLEAFLEYSHRRALPGAAIFIDADRMAATTVLNLGVVGSAGHADDTATIALDKTAAFVALGNTANGSIHTQVEVAEFLEDWADHIECFNEAARITPQAASMAVRKITVEQATKAMNQEGTLGNTQSAFEAVQKVAGGDVLPEYVYFTCIPYVGLQVRTFVMRMGVITSGQKPALTLRIIKLEEHKEQMAGELVSLIENGIAEAPATGEAPTVLIGTYQKTA